MAVSSTNSASAREEHCKSQFESFLRARQYDVHIEWEYVLQSQQPPDYYLTLDGRRYAVEITGLMPLTTVDGKPLQEVAVISALWRLVEQIEQSALAEGILEGQYSVFFIKPVQNLAGMRRQLRARITDYLRRTKSELSYPEEVIIPYTCLIRKIANTHPAIYPVGPGGGGGEGQIRNEACQLLASALATKLEKLTAKNLSSPLILLLENYHNLAKPEYYYDCARTLSLVDEFHTIYLVQSNTGIILHSREPSWVQATR